MTDCLMLKHDCWSVRGQWRLLMKRAGVQMLTPVQQPWLLWEILVEEMSKREGKGPTREQGVSHASDGVPGGQGRCSLPGKKARQPWGAGAAANC